MYSGTDTLYVELVYSHTRTDIQSLFLTLFIPVTLFAYTSHQFLFVYTSHQFYFVYKIHQRPRGGERLAGRYSAEERLQRLLRPSRCAGRVRSVGTSREGRGLSRCRAADSGRAASTSMWTSGRRWRG